MPRNSRRVTAGWPAPERWLAAAIGAALFVATAADAQARRSGPARTQRIDMVVIHSTGGPTCDARTGRPVWVGAGTLADNLREIEAHPRLGIHYMIDRDGRVRASVPEDQVAHHVFRHSGRSIAVELVNDGDGRDPFPEPQLAALVALLKDIAARRGIVRSGVVRHSDLDHAMLPCDRTQRRKVDPGPAYPHDAVLDRVFAPS
jgi:N-acetyl-anhydromuramyl-L-alanine amidase AmpD